MKKLAFAIFLLTVGLSAWSSELYTPQAVPKGDNEELVAKTRFNSPESGDMYLATMMGGKLWFLLQGPTLTESIIPFRANETFQGEYPLFSIKAGVLPPGNYPLYQVVTVPNGKLLNEDGSLNVTDWIDGTEGLNFLSFSVGLPTEVHGDHDGDGFADDDRNRDGFHDDDYNRDGFHDDDADKDGFHDDDKDKDGFHDNPPPSNSSVKVLAFNDLGMHCMDKDFSVMSILPPFNIVNAQVVKRGSDGFPELLDETQVELRYSPVKDRSGSINSSSKDKTHFWQYAEGLFEKKLQPGESLTGLYMPADNPQAPGEQPFHYNSQQDWFSAEGIPITPVDDKRRINPYPMLQVSAYDKQTGERLGATNVVVPVSIDVSCTNCHASGKTAANNPAITWATDDDLEVQAKKNILRLHDKQHGSDLQNQTPVLCASCHYSPALDLAKTGPQGMQQGLSTNSQIMHKFHGELRDAEGNFVIPTGNDVPVERSCYNCHPGKTTQCQRGVMKASGLDCTACHGGLLAVGGKFPLLEGGSIDGTNDGGTRRPWLDLPRCQSCHIGDAVNHLQGEGLEFHTDGIRLVQAYKTGDESASPLLAKNKRFAENENTLFRNSKGHGGIACEGCHGSTHAIWPNADANANDNLTAIQLQGHSGTIIECDTCHAPGSLEVTIYGPHGMHNVNDPRWTDHEHEFYYMFDPNSCKACHGKQLEGTPLSKVAVTRTHRIEDRTITLKKGQQVSCDLCHDKDAL
jgi:hypothetical protein